MKVINFASMLVLGAALSFVSTGCKHKPVNVTPLPGPRAGGVNDNNPGVPFGSNTNDMANGNPTAVPQPDPTKFENYKQDESFFAADTVHFAYDSSVIRSEDKSKVAHVADYLKSNPTHAVQVQGHCDERGTDEYNRALGERRALAIRENLISLGADASRITTVSFGRQRPVDTANTDEAHAKNRRGVFVLMTPP